MPDARVALAVGVGIRRQDVARHVTGQIPLAVAGAKREIDAGEVTV